MAPRTGPFGIATLAKRERQSSHSARASPLHAHSRGEPTKDLSSHSIHTLVSQCRHTHAAVLKRDAALLCATPRARPQPAGRPGRRYGGGETLGAASTSLAPAWSLLLLQLLVTGCPTRVPRPAPAALQRARGAATAGYTASGAICAHTRPGAPVAGAAAAAEPGARRELRSLLHEHLQGEWSDGI